MSSCADPAQELTFHYSLHTSLDVIEEKLSASNKAAGSDQRELYLGALNSSEHQKVFGYVTNTRIKFVIIVDSSNTSLRDNETRQMFRSVYFIFTLISGQYHEEEKNGIPTLFILATNFRRLHLAFTNAVANPFYVPGQQITSKKFDAVVRSLLGLREH